MSRDYLYESDVAAESKLASGGSGVGRGAEGFLTEADVTRATPKRISSPGKAAAGPSSEKAVVEKASAESAAASQRNEPPGARIRGDGIGRKV